MTARTPSVHEMEWFELESGEVLRDVRQAYFLDGSLNTRRDNLVVIFHALTGSADAAEGWWPGTIGPGKAIDTDRWAVLCTNLLGSCYGTTGPWEAARRPFPRVTTRDMARLVHRLVNELRVGAVELAVGGSLGGMVALEWAATYPELTRTTLALAAPAEHTAAAIGWNHIQRRMIAAAGDDGLEIARMVATMTYRTPDEFDERFGRAQRDDGRFYVESYLDRHGEKLRARFDTHSYLTLLDAMDSHDVGRDRGGAEAALRRYGGRLVGVGIPGDRLYSEHDVRRWTNGAGAEYRELYSLRGHDGFLLEADQVTALLVEILSPRPTAYGRLAGGIGG